MHVQAKEESSVGYLESGIIFLPPTPKSALIDIRVVCRVGVGVGKPLGER